MRQEFKQTVGEIVASVQAGESSEPLEGKSMEAQSNSPLRVTCSHHQHLADYIKLFMEEGEEMTLVEDWATPLITEVPLYSPI